MNITHLQRMLAEQPIKKKDASMLKGRVILVPGHGGPQDCRTQRFTGSQMAVKLCSINARVKTS
jgi:hypothetical protein